MQNDDPKTEAPEIHVRQWREARGMTQQQLADAIGRDKSVVSKLERGLSGLTGATLSSIAQAMGINPGALYEPPPDGSRPVREDEAAQVGSVSIKKPRANAEGFVPSGLVGDRADLPIYASAAGGSTGMLITYEPIDWVKRPEPLFNVRNGFGMYVVGDSMEPAYRQGDMILVHPNRPANSGDDVLVVKNDGNGSHEALVKTLVSTHDGVVKLHQHNPADEFTVPQSQVHAVYLIVGKYNRR